MSITVTRTDGDALNPPPTGTTLTDEETLHTVFLAQYDALLTEARSKLGADAAMLGAKCVEGAFVRAWDARTRFQTQGALDQFLMDDVHHGAARALSRRAAAHRFAGHEGHAGAHVTGDVSTAQSWDAVMHALHGEAHSPQALADAAAASRHEAAEHINVMTKGAPNWKAIGFGLAVLAIGVAGAFWADKLAENGRVSKALGASDARIVTSATAQMGNVALDDGSKVRLAPESKMTIPTSFGGGEIRAVRLEGLGSFDVAPGKKPEFQVRARDVAVLAKGTSFTVRAYPGDSGVTVVVDKGSVEVRQGESVQLLAAGGATVLRPGVSPRDATPAEREEADGWRTGTLAVNDRALREVLPQLKRWYGSDILVKDLTLLDRKVTMRASLDSLLQAIHGVEKSAGVEFGYVGPNMVFQSPIAKKPRR
ncbi:MAG: FecR domain-containing protein [bacterium]